MSNIKIIQAIESHLKALDPTFPTAWPNVNFNPPTTAFQAPFVLFAEPDNAGFAGSPYIQRGFVIITLLYPLNQGAGPAQTKAESVRTHFTRGISLNAGDFDIVFDKTADIGGGAVEDGRFVVRVRCRFYAVIPATVTI